MDQILIKDLLIRGVIGVTERERENPQDILVNMIVYAHVRKAGQTDNVDDSVNYRTIAKKVFAFVEHTTRHTVEALATDIARMVLEEPNVAGVRVRVEKPGAVRFSASVGVEIERWLRDELARPHQAFVILGSNIEPEENITAAVRRLRQNADLQGVSSVWETEPIGSQGPNFLNAAAWVATTQAAEELKWSVLREIEKQMGRTRSEDKNAPRTIDLDVIVFDGQVIDERVWELAYLAVPLCELYPYLTHPRTGQSLREIAQRLRGSNNMSKREDVKLPG